MAKIIQFQLPSRDTSGNGGFKTPAKGDNPPPRRQKEPVVISVMPGEPFPMGHRDFRPLLQRDGLILISWARWEDWYGDESFLRRYIVTWVTSRGNTCRYATEAVEEKDLAVALPERRRDRLFHRGVYGSIGGYNPHAYSDRAIADYLYFAAPFDLTRETIPGFIGVLKALGSTVNFDYVFTLGGVKRNLAREYLEKIASTQVIG